MPRAPALFMGAPKLGQTALHPLGRETFSPVAQRKAATAVNGPQRFLARKVREQYRIEQARARSLYQQQARKLAAATHRRWKSDWSPLCLSFILVFWPLLILFFWTDLYDRRNAERSPRRKSPKDHNSKDESYKIRNVAQEYMKGHAREYPEGVENPIPHIDKTMKTWISVSQNTDCHPDSEDLLTDELLRTLILYGEMDVLFRIASHPDVCLPKLWTQGGKFAFDLGCWGLSEVKETALLAYICLNVFYLKPELYDSKMRERMLKEKSQRHSQTLPTEAYDYRLTSAYQQMLVYCTGTGDPNPHHGAHKIPHREFFGVPFGMYTSMVPWHSTASYHNKHFGMVPLQDLVDRKFPQKHVPSKGDVLLAQKIFRALKVPRDITLRILEVAEYTPKGRLQTHGDPLHIDNAEELRKYLAYCWKLLVRVDMLMKENGALVDWEYEVAEAIYKLFGVRYPQMSKLVKKEEEELARLAGKRTFLRVLDRYEI
ncbi:hypothetical protein GRF29_112g188247 [Pseudopithomyces chartarum]|uniref:Uncharacterized protein n=1 Tax=Pseudopithomyces chartarum TaxID=1892770 RepID=A0AAN6LVP4_9PLEO|nr:hypothetical protein GRF29_112g188247 [Pseudopithomyces chartarum]